MCMTDLLKHLQTRRSVSVKHLIEPAPTGKDLEDILKLGRRTPDHGKMAPYYFITFEGEARVAIGKHLRAAYEADNPDTPVAKLDLEAERFTRAPLVIGVISRIREGKHPQWEQILTSGAVCMNIMHACYAHGFAANWLTEWYAYSAHFKKALGLEDARDHVAGFIYVGTPADTKDERERPELSQIHTRWTAETKALKKGESYNRDGYGLPRKGFDLKD